MGNETVASSEPPIIPTKQRSIPPERRSISTCPAEGGDDGRSWAAVSQDQDGHLNDPSELISDLQ